jgi:hypothetical protein
VFVYLIDQEFPDVTLTAKPLVKIMTFLRNLPDRSSAKTEPAGKPNRDGGPAWNSVQNCRDFRRT